MRWGLKIYRGQHEAVISEELFEATQALTKEKIKKKRLYKEYLLSGLVKCAECGSTMTNTFTNKKEGRYYYYKCVKVIKEGKNACSTKSVSAIKLEEFITQNLSRISQDKQYIENLVLRILHESGGRPGLELSSVSSKDPVTRVSQVVINFKNKIQDGSKVEKCLIFQKTIEGIKFSKDSLEVTISIRDADFSVAVDFFKGQSGNVAGRLREDTVNPDAPACNTRFENNIGCPARIRT